MEIEHSTNSAHRQRVLDRLNGAQLYLASEFVEGYEDGLLPRRDLVERIARMVGGIGSAASLLLALGVIPRRADAQGVPGPYLASGDATSAFAVSSDDPAIVASEVTIYSGTTPVAGYLAAPVVAGRFPAIAICHENAGTAEHFRDVARRFAKAGYVAIHLDLLSREGGTDAVPVNERAAALTGPGKAELFVEDYRAAFTYLQSLDNVLPGSLGMTGYCFGGSVTWNVACREPRLRVAIPFYGPPGFPDELPRVRAASLGVYGQTDARVNASIPSVQAGLAIAGVPHDVRTYEGAGHAFFNDTRGAYSEPAATQAWQDTLEWCATHLPRA